MKNPEESSGTDTSEGRGSLAARLTLSSMLIAGMLSPHFVQRREMDPNGVAAGKSIWLDQAMEWCGLKLRAICTNEEAVEEMVRNRE